jgi:hypothetical protein
MIRKLILTFLLASFSICAQATPWSDLEPGTVLRLRDSLQLEEGYRFKKGGTFALHRIDFLDSIQVEMLSLRLFPCPRSFADKKAELQIINEKYGLEMDLQCEITLFVEMKDYYSESLFEASPR